MKREKNIFILANDILCLEKEYEEFLGAEYDYFGNVKSYNIDLKTFNFKYNDLLQAMIKSARKELKLEVGLWNYFLFNFARAIFYKKFNRY